MEDSITMEQSSGTNGNGPEEPTLSRREPDPQSDPRMYTEDDLARVRQQEKDKMYKRLETVQEQVKALEADARKRAEAEEAKQREIRQQEENAAKLANLQAEQEMSAKELLEKKEAEWMQKMQAIEQQVEQERALRERESQFAELMEARQQIINQFQDRVAPELLDLIGGDTPEEIMQSANDMAARTERILAQTQEAMQNMRQQTPTARVSLPASGENSGSQRTFSPEEIREMSMSDYAKHRKSLLGNGTSGPSNRGLFG